MTTKIGLLGPLPYNVGKNLAERDAAVGEFADMAIDDMLSVDYHQLNGDFDPDDDPEWNPFSGRWSRFKSRPRTCNKCGTTGLWWDRAYHDDTGVWRLEDSQGNPHRCQHSFKSFIGKRDEYNEYLDTIPWTSEPG